MEKKNTNKYLIIANILAFIYFISGHFIFLPDIVKGFCAGICIVMYSIGLYSLKHDINKLKQFKKKLMGRI